MAESSTGYSRSVTNIFHWILHTFPNTNMINMLKWLNQIQETIYWAISRQWAVPGANSDWGGPPHSCMPQVGVWGRAPSPWPQGDSRKWGYLRNWKYPQKVPALVRKHQISSNFTSFGTLYIGLSWPQCWGKRTKQSFHLCLLWPIAGPQHRWPTPGAWHARGRRRSTPRSLGRRDLWGVLEMNIHWSSVPNSCWFEDSRWF